MTFKVDQAKAARVHYIIEDKRAEAIYTLFEDEIENDAQRKRLIHAEREKYLRGEGKIYAWNEVKQMALNKEKRNEIIV